MEVRDGALLGVSVELLLQPFLLPAPRLHRERRIDDDLAVERDHLPFAEVIGVVALPLFAGVLAKVVVVRLAEAVIEVVIPDGGPELAHDALRGITPRGPPAAVVIGL